MSRLGVALSGMSSAVTCLNYSINVLRFNRLALRLAPLLVDRVADDEHALSAHPHPVPSFVALAFPLLGFVQVHVSRPTAGVTRPPCL